MTSENKSLMSLVALASQIESMLIDSGGVLTEEIEALLSIKDLGLPEKVDNYAMVMDRMDMVHDFYVEKAEFFLRLSKAAENVRERCRFNLKMAMQHLDTDEISGNDIRFKLINSQPTCVIDDESVIDVLYKISETITRIDKRQIANAIKDGIPVPGAHLEQNRHLKVFANIKGKK